MNRVHVMSCNMWMDVIKWGWDPFYRVYDVIHIVAVMSYIQRVWYHRTSGFDHTDPVAVMSYAMDMMSWIIADVISKIQLVWYQQNSGSDDTGTVDTMSNIVGVMSWKRWSEDIKWGFDVLYSANDATVIVSVMSYKEWVWWCLYGGCDDTDSGCDVSCIRYMLPYILDEVSYMEVVMSSVE